MINAFIRDLGKQVNKTLMDHTGGKVIVDDDEACEFVQIITDHLEPLFRSIGDVGYCKGCTAKIFWVKHKNGKATPYTPYGINHFVDCPKAKKFKKEPT